ncbi:MAG: UvrD-helicase domain-containing protein, partial [Pseudonocardiaceae bacterium]
LNAIAQLMRYLENYNVPLDAYRAIHKAIEASFPADVAGELSKQNLNLLMNHTLDQLDRIRPTLAAPVVPTAPGCAPVLPAHLSAQQREAVSTTEPLVMTQAGAGTGKSTVILDRIGFLTQCGVDAAEITVLSFTNAAADNITDRNPDVGSMTIARMIHDIYALNHPTHELSSVDTIINSIDIFYPNNSFAATLRGLLLKVAKKDAHASTALNTFLENNFDAVIALLDRIKQTSLELEIVICYQRIDTMVEPAHVACRYLIIDEVQDNSIFEFIYLLKHVTKNAQSLYMVGDASQTLYEWRFANPRALNTLESSGVFATYKLSTNYRSNQEILDFANIVLGGLETNRFAEIQLRANDLTVPTADSFQEKVTLDYRAFPRLREFEEDLPQILANTVVPDYVRGCIDRGEQVAFLAYTRRAALTAQQVFEQAFPGKHIANLTSEKTYATDVFSQFIKHYWNDV